MAIPVARAGEHLWHVDGHWEPICSLESSRNANVNGVSQSAGDRGHCHLDRRNRRALRRFHCLFTQNLFLAKGGSPAFILNL